MEPDSASTNDPFLDQESIHSSCKSLSAEGRIYDFCDDAYKPLRERIKKRRVMFKDQSVDENVKKQPNDENGRNSLQYILDSTEMEDGKELLGNGQKGVRREAEANQLENGHYNESEEGSLNSFRHQDLIHHYLCLADEGSRKIEANNRCLEKIVKQAVLRTSEVVQVVDIFGEATIKRGTMTSETEKGIQEVRDKFHKQREMERQRLFEELCEAHRQLRSYMYRETMFKRISEELMTHIIELYGDVLIPNVLCSDIPTNRSVEEVMAGEELVTDEILEKRLLTVENELEDMHLYMDNLSQEEAVIDVLENEYQRMGGYFRALEDLKQEMRSRLASIIK